MTTVAQVLALAMWIPLTLLGAWNLVTGRKFRFRSSIGIPNWPLRDGWQIRLFGLVYVVGCGYVSVAAIRGDVRWEAIIGTYVFAFLALGILIQRSLRKSAGRGRVTAPR